MASPDRLAGFFTDEWNRFASGVEALDPQSAEQVKVRLGQERARRDGGAIVSTPAWDDVIHLAPKWQPSAADREEYWTARRARRPANLPPEQIAELDRRADVIRRIRAAPDAETAASWGRILTALDNVQDFFSMLSLFGRLAIWAAPRVLGRLIPGVNIVLGISDLLNLLSLIGMSATPLYQLLCKGPTAALAAGAPVLMMKKALKSKLWADALRSPWSRFARPRQALPALTARKLFGGALETLQTTDQLYGVGVSMGALVGLVNQAAHAAVLAAKGEPLRVRDNPISAKLTELINRPLSDDPKAELRLQHQAALVLAGAPAILSRPDQFTDDEVLVTLGAHLEAQRVLYARLANYDWLPIVLEATEASWSPLVQLTPGTAYDVEQLHLDPDEFATWEIPGAPHSATGRELVEYYAAAIPPALGAWLLARRNDAGGSFAGTIINQATEEGWQGIARSRDALTWQLAPDWRLAAGLAESGYLVSINAPGDALWAFWEAARRELYRQGGTSLRPSTWPTLAARYSIPLIRQLPPDAPWPAPWREWLDSTDAAPSS